MYIMNMIYISIVIIKKSNKYIGILFYLTPTNLYFNSTVYLSLLFCCSYHLKITSPDSLSYNIMIWLLIHQISEEDNRIGALVAAPGKWIFIIIHLPCTSGGYAVWVPRYNRELNWIRHMAGVTDTLVQMNQVT